MRCERWSHSGSCVLRPGHGGHLLVTRSGVTSWGNLAQAALPTQSKHLTRAPHDSPILRL